MSLDKGTLKASIKGALLAQRNITSDPTAAADQLAGAIADAVDAFVKQAQVNYSTGLTAGGDPVVGSMVHTIS